MGAGSRMSEIIKQLESALAKVAVLVIENPAYAPIFARLELELELEQERAFASDDVLARARAITAQRQMAFA